MSIVLNDDFAGTIGAAFTGDSTYSMLAGSATYQACSYGTCLRFALNSVNVVSAAITSTSGPRTFSRIYKISAIPTTAGGMDIWQTRLTSGGGRGPGARILNSTGQLRILTSAVGTIATTAASVPIGTEFRVTYTINAAGTTLSAAVFPDTTSTTPTETISGAITAQAFNVVRDGTLNTPGATQTLDLIWPQDSDTIVDPGPRTVTPSVSLNVSEALVGSSVTATASVANAPTGTKTWTYHWGDGNSTGPQAGASASHTYSSTGVFSVTVDVTINSVTWTSPAAATLVIPKCYYAKNVGGTAVPVRPAVNVSGTATTVTPAYSP